MKIEKINDRQIRCVLSKEDLENRKIRLSELVCGGEKARGLLRDMILRATRELGFSFNNNPLMIEAVPTGTDQLVLIITRVDDPKELDSRFSSLSGGFDSGKEDSDTLPEPTLSGADDILNLLRHFSDKLKEHDQKPDREIEAPSGGQDSAKKGKSGKKAGAPGGKKPGKSEEEELYKYTRFYLFRNLEYVLSAAKRVPEAYEGENSLYKNPDDGAYYLLVKKMDTDPEQFNRICNMLSEYSMPMDYSSGMDEFFNEHMQVIVPQHAMQHLRGV